MSISLVSGPENLVYSRNPIVVTIALESDPEYTDVYALCHVYQDSTLITTLFARPNSDYNAVFDVAPVVDSLTSFIAPTLSENFLKLNDFAVGYWCRIEQFSAGTLINTLDVGKTGYDINWFAIKGGLSQEKASLNIFSKLSNDKMFLSWINKNEVLKNQPSFLYYFHQASDANIIAYAKVYYADGTSSPATVINDFGTVETNNLVICASGFDQLSLGDIDNTKIPIRYLLWFQSDTTVVAGYYYYTLTEDYVPIPITIFFANSLGGFETLHLRGKIENSLDPESNEIISFVASGKLTSSLNHMITPESEASTGYLSKDHLKACADLFLSKETYIVAGEQLVKVIVSTKTKFEYTESDNLLGLTIQYKRAFTNKNYTPDVTD